MEQKHEFIVEHMIFHELVRKNRRPDVGRAYLAIQAGIADHKQKIDIGRWLSKVLPEGYNYWGGYAEGLGASGLAFFHFLFEVELVDAGATDYHSYRFTRRYDRGSIVARLKTSCDPESRAYLHELSEMRSKLARTREKMMIKNRWGTLEDLFTSAQSAEER